MKKLTSNELKRLKCYTIAKSKKNDGCGVKLKVVALSGARVAFNIETDYRIAMIRLDELSKVIDVPQETIRTWVRDERIESKRENGHRWLDVDSIVEFLKTHDTITLRQRELFDSRLIEVYDKILSKMTNDTEKLGFIFRIV